MLILASQTHSNEFYTTFPFDYFEIRTKFNENKIQVNEFVVKNTLKLQNGEI